MEDDDDDDEEEEEEEFASLLITLQSSGINVIPGAAPIDGLEPSSSASPPALGSALQRGVKRCGCGASSAVSSGGCRDVRSGKVGTLLRRRLPKA